jgi:hypothetical protein
MPIYDAFTRLLDSFLKFDASSEQLRLEQAGLKIDEAFQTLSPSESISLNFGKIEHVYEQTFNVIGNAFIHVGSDFHKVETAEHLIGNAVGKLLGDQKIGDLLPAVQQDFKALDYKIDAVSRDISHVGVDFLKLDSSPNQQVFDHKVAALGANFLNLGGDAHAAYDAFHKLSTDFLELGSNGDRSSPAIRAEYLKFSGDLELVGSQFDTLANDFLKLNQAIQADGSVSIGDNAAGGGGGAGKVLAQLYQDFYALGGGLNTLGGSANALIGLLSQAHKIDSGPPTIVGDVINHGGGHGSD